MPHSRTAELVCLLDADPDLGLLLSDERRAQAQRELVVRTYRLALGAWDVSRLAGASADHLGLLILEGVLSRELVLADQVSTELLGAGDLVRPWPSASRTTLMPVQAIWSVLSSASVAVLDRRFAAEAARYPELTSMLFDRLSERSLRLATSQAISQLTCVDRRLVALFWHLAERWGRVSGDGVIVPLALTHRTLGELVGARRPTISTALAELAHRGELVRRPDGSWLLHGDMPDHDAIARRSASSAREPTRSSQRFVRKPRELDRREPTAATTPASVRSRTG